MKSPPRWCARLLLNGANPLASTLVSVITGRARCGTLVVRSGAVQSGDNKECGDALMDDLASFLASDLPHLFDAVGIDKRAYDERIAFIDPITRYQTLDGYLFNIAFLRAAFKPRFVLLGVIRSRPNELVTRWSMTMEPFHWSPFGGPQLRFTGRSFMTVDCATGRFNSHRDEWDSITNNEYFSTEGVADLIGQLCRPGLPADVTQPASELMRRFRAYEIRRYPLFAADERFGELQGPVDVIYFSRGTPVLVRGGRTTSLDADQRLTQGGLFAVKLIPGLESITEAAVDLRAELLGAGISVIGEPCAACYGDPVRRSELWQRIAPKSVENC